MLYTEEILRCVTKAVDTERRSCNRLYRHVRCRLFRHRLKICPHSLDAFEDAFECGIGLWLVLLFTLFVVSSSCRFCTTQYRLNGVEHCLELGSLLFCLPGSLFCSKVIGECSLILLLIFGYDSVEFLLRKAFVVELLFKTKKFENGDKFFFEIHKTNN